MNKQNNLTTTKKMPGAIKLIVAVLCVLLLLAAGAFSVMQVGASSNASDTSDISMQQATEVALQDAGFSSSEVESLSGNLDSDDEVRHYDVSFVSQGMEYDYEIKASDGTILEKDREAVETHSSSQNVSLPAESSTMTDSDFISIDEAKSIALQVSGVDASNAVFTEAELNVDDGVHIYEIEFISGDMEYSFEINAMTGSVAEWEKESIYD
ncbi:MAG: PepSY domain-containing protein [Candidatus Fimisoma sp.]|nr:PepSY domain-containing protein [Bacillota bacterium]MDY4747678.1 PepSY domain-containing protein [Candidatus Fimisoma sp.]